MTTLPMPGTIPPIDNTTFNPDLRHFHAGRGGHIIDLIVLHSTETRNTTQNAPSGPWLSTQSPGGESIHHLYGRNGIRYDIVHRSDVAYHAGVSAWGPYHGADQGIGLINWVSIGHELESTSTQADPGNGYTDLQLASCAYTVATELVSYGLPWSHVVRHAEIALFPLDYEIVALRGKLGRRHDPGHFDMPAFQARVDAWVAYLRTLSGPELATACR